METKWEDSFEDSMKHYLDELSIECANEINEWQTGDGESIFLKSLVEKVEEKFMRSVKSSLKASRKAIMSNDGTRAVSFQNYQLID